MAWVFITVIGASIGCWYYFRRENESYSEFTGRHIGTFIGAVNGAIQKVKKEKETKDEAKENS